MTYKIIFTWAGLVLAITLIGGCGKKTAPIPSRAIIPASVNDLAYKLDENGVTLSWSSPSPAGKEKGLPVVDKFLVERAEYGLADFCQTCPVHYLEVAVISGEALAARQDKVPTYRDEQLRGGYIYFYRVKTGSGWRIISPPSEPVSFRWQMPVVDERPLSENLK